MAVRSKPLRIRSVRLGARQPSIAIGDLAMMLKIDLALGRCDDFRQRLQHALDDAGRQGAENVPYS